MKFALKHTLCGLSISFFKSLREDPEHLSGLRLWWLSSFKFLAPQLSANSINAFQDTPIFLYNFCLGVCSVSFWLTGTDDHQAFQWNRMIKRNIKQFWNHELSGANSSFCVWQTSIIAVFFFTEMKNIGRHFAIISVTFWYILANKKKAKESTVNHSPESANIVTLDQSFELSPVCFLTALEDASRICQPLWFLLFAYQKWSYSMSAPKEA